MTDTTMKTRGAVPGPIATAAPGGPQSGQEVAVRDESQRTGATQPESQRAVAVQPAATRMVKIDVPIGEIAGAIAGVSAEIGVVDKTGINQFHKYKYATIGDILTALTPLMGKHGLAVIQNEVERTTVETRLAVTYEFSIIHKSNEYWPERPRITGSAIARDSKGNWDDKAFNKCHTAARKYFLLALFQVPTNELDDADDGGAQKQQTSQQQRPTQNRGPVPGPSQQQKPAAQDPTKPHKIVLGEGSGADQWSNAYIKALGSAKTLDELKAWDTANDGALQGLNDRYPEVYKIICEAYEMREAGLKVADPQTGEIIDRPAQGPGPDDEIIIDEMPNPANDATGAVNWIAQRLTDIQKPDDVVEFWSETVQPRLGEFSAPDIAVIEGELRRANARLAGQKVR